MDEWIEPGCDPGIAYKTPESAGFRIGQPIDRDRIGVFLCLNRLLSHPSFVPVRASDPPGGDLVCRRARAGGQRGDFDGGGFVPAPRIEVLGILNGYAHLVEFCDDHPMQEGPGLHRPGSDEAPADAEQARHPDRHVAHQPGQGRPQPGHLDDPEKTAQLRTVHQAPDLAGGRRADLHRRRRHAQDRQQVQRFQDLPPEDKRIAVVHVPKTIDNDYRGIDFTFGYFTAVETLAGEILNLLADAEAGRMYFLVETMGRSAGWLAYGAAIAGEASLVLSVEDLVGDLDDRGDRHRPQDRRRSTRRIMNIDESSA